MIMKISIQSATRTHTARNNISTIGHQRRTTTNIGTLLSNGQKLEGENSSTRSSDPPAWREGNNYGKLDAGSVLKFESIKPVINDPQVGCEETVAWKVMNRATHPSNPDVLVRSVIGRRGIPGRVFAEAYSEAGARSFARSIGELNPSALRIVPPEEFMAILYVKNPFSFNINSQLGLLVRMEYN
jgi:hypothetical protein